MSNEAKIEFNNKKRLFTANNMNWTTKKTLLKAFVWSGGLHVCETWTLRLM